MSFYLYIRYGGSLKRKALPQNTPSPIDLLRTTALCSGANDATRTTNKRYDYMPSKVM